MNKVITRTRKEVINRWVKALQSGKYKQTNGMLRNNTNGQYSYCCLGVLCQLAEDDGGQQYDEYGGYGTNEDYEFPPKEMMEFVFDVDFCEFLAEMNDEGASFNRIANAILSKLKEEECVGIA